MTSERTIEEKLKQLAQSISPDDRLIENVMSRIDVSPIAGPPNRPAQNIWRVIMKSSITKIAAAVVIILVIVFGITFVDESSTSAYGMTDALELMNKAKTLHIRGWLVRIYGSPPKEMKLPFEHWYDLENGRYRMNYSNKSLVGNEIDHRTRICDGEYIMSEGRYRPADGQVHKYIRFEKVDPAKKVNIKSLDWYSTLRQIEGFHKIGQEVISGERFDIWEGEYNSGVGDTSYRRRLRIWLSAKTAHVGRSKAWRKKGNEDWIQISEYTIFEWNASLPEGIFKTEPPAGYEIKTAKEDATVRVKQERDIYEGTQFGYAPLNYWVDPVFHLKDGSLLACWQSVDAKESSDQSGYFQGLRVGGGLPKLPTEIFALSPEPNVRDVQFIGYHLTFTLKETEKGKRWYEWSLYIPDKEPPPINSVLKYRIHRRLNVNRTKDIENRRNQSAVTYPQEIKTEEDFNTFVLDAMAKRNDGGFVPEYVNYENIMQFSEQLKESLAQ